MDDAPAYLALGAATEQDAVGHDHADHALRFGDAEHVHEEGQVPPCLGRDGVVTVEAVMGVVGREVVAPVLQAEGRISDDTVIGEEAARRVHQSRLGDDVAGFQAGSTEAVEEEVQLSDGQSAQVAFLPVERKIAVITALLPHVLGCIDEHAAGAAVGSQMRMPSCGWSSSMMSRTTGRGV